MSNETSNGDQISVGNISNAQGIGVGKNVSVNAQGASLSSATGIDPNELRSALEDLFDVLASNEIPREVARKAQTSAGNAIEGISEKKVDSDAIGTSIKKVGEILKSANVTVQQGTSLWNAIHKLSPLLGPLVGGTKVVANWFGIPL